MLESIRVRVLMCLSCTALQISVVYDGRSEQRTTVYASFKYSLLKTSLPGSAFGARFRWGSGVETFLSTSIFLNSEVRSIDIFRLEECSL